MKPSFVGSLQSFAVVFGAASFYAAPAAAQTIGAVVELTNTTDMTFMIPSSGASVSDQWSTNSLPTSDMTTADGSPPGILGPGQTIAFGSQSGSGFLNGTGGSLDIPDVGTLTWSVPYGYFIGLPNTYCDSSVNGAGGFTVANLSGGWSGTGGANTYTCTFSFGLTPQVSEAQWVPGQLTPGQALSRGTSFSYVGDGTLFLQLQDDGNLVLTDYSVNPPNPLWWANTANTGASVALMQGDGNFVLYDVYANPVWWSGTAGNNFAYLTVDGNPGLDYGVIIHAQGGAPLAFVAP